MDTAPVVPQSFFLLNKECFIRHIDPGFIVPRLQDKGVLSDVDCHSLSLRATKSDRNEHLCNILASKDSSVPWTLLECLQEGSSISDGNAELSDVLVSFLQPHWPEGPVNSQHEHPAVSAVMCNPTAKYSSVITHIDTTFRERNVTTNQVLDTIEAIFEEDGMQVTLPTASLNNFPSIALCLRERGLCHELDTDLLCKLLKRIPTNNDLHFYVRDYSDFRSGSYVLDQNFSGIGHLSDQSSAIMFRDLLHLTLHDIFFLKDFLAHYFGIGRHCFSLTGAVTHQSQSHLAWQITAPVRDHFDANAFENDLAVLSISKLELCRWKDGEVTRQVYCAREHAEQGDGVLHSAACCQPRMDLDSQLLPTNQGKRAFIIYR